MDDRQWRTTTPAFEEARKWVRDMRRWLPHVPLPKEPPPSNEFPPADRRNWPEIL